MIKATPDGVRRSASGVPRSLTGRVVRSSLWMLANSVAVRGASFATQLILAYLLTRQDFGVYAIGIAVSAMVTNFSGGGVIQWMVQGGREKFAERAGLAFWVCLGSNVVLGLLLVAMSRPASAIFGSPEVGRILLIMAVAQPLMTFPTYFQALLSIDLRMREFAIADTLGNIVRYGGTVILALAGMGPLSLVMPLPLTYIVAGGVAYRFSRFKPWHVPPRIKEWPRVVIRNRWILLGTLLITVGLQIDNLVLGRLAPLAVLGTYFFAYQLSYMTAAIITQNIRVILLPGLVAVGDSARAAAITRALVVGATISTPFLLLLAAVIAPLESLLWSGRWESAVLPVQVLSLGLPLGLLTAVTHSSLQSEARFRDWAGVNAFRAVFVAIGALVAGTLFASVGAVSVVMGVSLLLADAAVVIASLRVHGIPLGAVARGVSAALVAGWTGLGCAILLSAAPLPDVMLVAAAATCMLTTYAIVMTLIGRKPMGLAIGAIRQAVKT